MDMRELKGLELAARAKITFDSAGFWVVPSQSGSGKYRVVLRPEADSCNCEDFALTGKPGKHVHAARIVRERDGGKPAPTIDTDSIPKKPTYAQDWANYNLAQSIEKHRLQELLADLCRGIQEPPLAKTGPRPHLAKDAIFAMAYKVYEGFSARRFASDLKDVHKSGYVSRPIPGMKMCAFFNTPTFTPILKELVSLSARPLRTIEKEFAVDSSGFSTSKFVRWYDEKYGVERSGHDWVKVHLMCGVKTNVVTSARIEGRDAADCPQFAPLVKKTAETFTIDEVSGDKAYLSAEKVETVAECGGMAFIAPKTSTTGGIGGLFEKMFHYYQFRRDEFLRRYHKRSNVESTFSMVKRKFGDAVRGRNDTSMVNEVYCKLICHNLCCLIHSQCELGIEPVFWGDNPAPVSPDVLPFVKNG
jgi:transposase